MILTAQEVLKRMKDPFPRKLVITPLLHLDQIHKITGSVDIRLGQEFIIAHQAALGALNPVQDPDDLSGQITDYLRRIHIPIGQFFVLHPRQFALGTTLEYFSLPGDIAAYVVGRSRWARIGLVIAMATFAHPGYSGCLTLELQNLGDVPIKLYPSLSVGQVIFHKTEGNPEIPYPRPSSQFRCATGPEFPLPLISEKDRKIIEFFKPTD